MALSSRAKKIVNELTAQKPKLGDIKKHGKEIQKDHDLATELWSTGSHFPRLLATLIFDKKLLSMEVMEELAADLLDHDESERQQISEWILANQIQKDRKLTQLAESWGEHPSPVLRRLYWYQEARRRWMGKTPPGSEELLTSIEAKLADEEPEVQWAMNFCCGWIGIFEPELRARCVALGEKTGLYRDEPVARNCTPSYLPEFIRIEVEKRA